MLISQRIIKDPNFLSMNVPGEYRAGLKDKLFELRMKVINAVKFVSDDYGITQDDDIIDLDKIEMAIFGMTNPGQKLREKQEERYHLFARPPYPLMTIESKTALMLLEDVSGEPDPDGVDVPIHQWRTTVIGAKGGVAPMTSVSAQLPERKRLRVRLRSVTPPIMTMMQRYIEMQAQKAGMDESARNNVQALEDTKFGKQIGQLMQLARLFQMVACESLTFINCRNVTQHLYMPTKKELAGIPKVLQDRMQYRVVDIFRDTDCYTSLKQIEESLNRPEETRKTRAHLVRGHFKKTKTGLFWWNPFVRCRGNTETVGIVEKDYHLHNDASSVNQS